MSVNGGSGIGGSRRHRHGRPPRPRRACARALRLSLLALGVALAIAPAGALLAHSFVRSTSPKSGGIVTRPPTRVVMRFNEPVELTFSRIIVTDPDGESVQVDRPGYVGERGDLVQVPVAPDLQNGRYEVVWRVISADGHPRQGTFRFRVDAPVPETPTPEEPEEPEGHGDEQEVAPSALRPMGPGTGVHVAHGIARGIAFLGLLLLAGLFLFRVWIWRRPATSFGERPATVEEGFTRRWGRIAGTAWAAALLATLASLPLQAAIAAKVPLSRVSTDMVGGIIGSRFGLVASLRIALLVLGLILWLAVARTRWPVAGALRPRTVGAAAATSGPLRGWVAWLGLALSVALLSTMGLAGHAGTTPPVALNMTLDTVHVAAAAAWIGGLVALVATALPSTRGLEERERVSLLAPVVSGFSNMAMVSVALIVLTGLARGWLEIRTLESVTGTTYGLTLLTKLAAFLPLLVLGAINNRWTKPRIRRAAEAGEGGDGLTTLRRLVWIEVLLVLVVVGITAYLVNLPPPRAGMAGH